MSGPVNFKILSIPIPFPIVSSLPWSPCLYSCSLKSIFHRTTALIYLKHKTKHFTHSPNPSAAPHPPQGEYPNFLVCQMAPPPACPSPFSPTPFHPLLSHLLSFHPRYTELLFISHLADSSLHAFVCVTPLWKSSLASNLVIISFRQSSRTPTLGKLLLPGSQSPVHFSCSTATKSY